MKTIVPGVAALVAVAAAQRQTAPAGTSRIPGFIGNEAWPPKTHVPDEFTWINDQEVLDVTDTANHAMKGITEEPIGIQIHGGPDRRVPGGFWRWRVIAVEELP